MMLFSYGVSEHEPEEKIVELAADHENDLIVMGTYIRPTTRRAFLDHTSEYIIRNADAAVAVVSST